MTDLVTELCRYRVPFHEEGCYLVKSMVPRPRYHDSVHFYLVLKHLIQARIHQQKGPVGRRGWRVDAA
jgi:hypothetical protein